MTTIRQSFRKWWQPPRKASNRQEERSVTFLELFYDLAYVVLVAQLAHSLLPLGDRRVDLTDSAFQHLTPGQE